MSQNAIYFSEGAVLFEGNAQTSESALWGSYVWYRSHLAAPNVYAAGYGPSNLSANSYLSGYACDASGTAINDVGPSGATYHRKFVKGGSGTADRYTDPKAALVATCYDISGWPSGATYTRGVYTEEFTHSGKKYLFSRNSSYQASATVGIYYDSTKYSIEWQSGPTVTGSSLETFPNYTLLKKFTIQFYKNVGNPTSAAIAGSATVTGSMQTMNCVEDESYTLTKNAFAKTYAYENGKYTCPMYFTGWNTKADGTGYSLRDEAVVSDVDFNPDAGATVKLYAQWRFPAVFIHNALVDGLVRGKIALYQDNYVSGKSPMANQANHAVIYDGVKAGHKYTLFWQQNGNTGDYYGAGVDTTGNGSANIQSNWAQTLEFTGNNLTTFDRDANGNSVITSGNKIASVVGVFIHASRTAFSVANNISTANATVTFSRQPTAVGGKYYGGELSVTIKPKAGKKITAYNMTAVSGSVSGDDQTNGVTVTFNLDSNITITGTFETVQCSVSAQIAAGHEVAVSAVEVTQNDAAVASVDYGSEVVFKETIEAGGSYYAGGWFDANGNRVSISNNQSHRMTVTSDTTLYARGMADVAVAFVDANGDPVTDGVSATIAGAFILSGHNYVDIGSSAAVTVDCGDKFFNGMFINAVTGNRVDATVDAEGHSASASVAVADYVSLVVRVSDTMPSYTVSVTANIANAGDFVTFRDVTGEILSAETPSAQTGSGIALGAGAGPTTTKTYQLDNIGHVEAEVVPAVDDKVFQGWFEAEEEEAEEEEADAPISTELTRRFYVLGDVTTYVRYATPQSEGIAVSVGYKDGSSAQNQGSVAIVGVDGEGKAPQGAEVTISAMPAIGYVFAGWYVGDELKEGWGAEYTFHVVTAVECLAKFSKDTSVIYKWEGSDKNKMMRWRSKLYVASKVFNPAAARVDASVRRGEDGGETPTLAQLTVEVHSSPDADPTSSTTLMGMTVVRGRRLPKMRAERYMAVEVQNDEQVDRIIVGTSMEGLAT